MILHLRRTRPLTRLFQRQQRLLELHRLRSVEFLVQVKTSVLTGRLRLTLRVQLLLGL